MMKQNSIKINFIMNIFLTMSAFIFPLITFPYVSRILLPDGIGKVSFVTSIVTYFNMFAQLGIPTYGIRLCAQVRDDKNELSQVVHELLFINLIMSVFMYITLAICIFLIPKLSAEKNLFIIISSTIVFNAIGVEWMYKGLEKYTYITIRSFIFKIIALIAMLVLVHEKKDYLIYGAITVFAASASNVLNFINSHKYVYLNHVKKYNIRRHVKPILIFFAMSCATIIYTNLDTVMLGFMTSDTDVGYYNAAVKIKVVLLGLVTSLGTVLLPRVSYYIEHDMKEQFWEISQKAIEFVFVISLPLIVYFIVFAKEGIYFLSGHAYGGAILPMQIIMPTLLWIGLTNIMGMQMLVPLGKEKYVLYSEIAGAIVDLLLNYVLIPHIASKGAAIGTVIAEFVVWIVQVIALKESVVEFYRRIQYEKLVIAILSATIVSFGIKILKWGEFTTLFISALLFGGTYLAILIITKEPLVLEIYNQMKVKITKIYKRILKVEKVD